MPLTSIFCPATRVKFLSSQLYNQHIQSCTRNGCSDSYLSGDNTPFLRCYGIQRLDGHRIIKAPITGGGTLVLAFFPPRRFAITSGRRDFYKQHYSVASIKCNLQVNIRWGEYEPGVRSWVERSCNRFSDAQCSCTNLWLRPVSLLIPTSGKEYHSQADSTALAASWADNVNASKLMQ